MHFVMSSEEANSLSPLVWIALVCKRVLYLWLWLQQIMQIFFLPTQSPEAVHAQQQTCALCPVKRRGKMTLIFKCIHAEAEWARKTRRPFSSAVIIIEKKLRLGLQHTANESNSKRSRDIDLSYSQPLFSTQPIILVSPADTLLP